MRSRLPRLAPRALALVTLAALAAPSARAGVCDPATLVSNRALCYGDGGIGNPANVASGVFAPTTPFVQGAQICVRYDVSATIEQGGYDRVFLRLSDNRGGQQDTCLAGKGPGDCSAPTNPNGGCLNFPAVTHELRGTACFSPASGASQVTAAVYVAPVDLGYQCGDACAGGGTLGVTVRTLAVTGCSGLGGGGACGDGVLDSGEQCDDGNRLAADGCGQTCQIEAGAICSGDGKRCAGDRTCAGVTPGDLGVHYCYSNASNLGESTLRWTWQVRPGGQPLDLYWDIEGGVELFKNGEYDSLWLTWSDDTGVGESFFINDGGLFQTAFYEAWSRATRRIQPAPGATSVTVTFWVQSDGATSCQQPKAGKGPFKDLAVNALTLSKCPVTATLYDSPAAFTQAMGRCYTVVDFNDFNENSVGPFDGDGWHADVDTNQPSIQLTADEAPYLTTQALGDGSVALEAQGYGNYESNSRLAIDFRPSPQRAIGLNLIDAGDGEGVMAVEAYRGGRLVYVNNDIGASAPQNNFITWKGIVFSEPVDRVVFFMIEGGDFFNIDNLVLRPQADADGDDVPDLCDCAPDDPDVATGFAEICDDLIDNDCDLLTDGGDPDCGGNETQVCGEYADEQLTSGNGGWLTNGNQAWTWVAAAGAWRAVSSNGIDASLETQTFHIPAGACDEVFKVAIDYGGSTEAGYDLLITSYALNGGAFVELDRQSGNLAPKTYALPASVAPGDAISLRFRYTTDAATLGNDPTLSRVRIFSDADQDADGVCDACDCAPANGAFGADCDLDGDGWCAVEAGALNADPGVAGCDGDMPPLGAGVGSDCDDAAPTANPGHAVETGYCNDGLDNDCDGPIDAADLPDCAVDDCTDLDGDGYGVGTTCIGPDCDDSSAACTTDCSDVDQDGIPDCRDGCIDRDGDGYGVGPGCTAPDCDDAAPTCTTDCTTDADANGIPDCKQDCVDGDYDGYGVGPGCQGPDCDDTAPQCTTDCSDSDADGIADCKDECVDKDHDHYGVGQGCVDVDCNDLVPTCTTDCETDGSDGNGIPDCEEVCEDADGDSYGIGPQCLGPDCDDTEPGCSLDCKDSDGDGAPDCADGDDDNDGLSDQGEAAYGTDPLNPDSDGDGLLDGQEVHVFETDPTQADTDGDGLSDGDEVKNLGTDPKSADSDGDGVSDGDEVAAGTDPMKAGDARTEEDAGCAGGGGAPGGLGALLLLALALLVRRRRRGLALALGLLLGALTLGAGDGAARAAGPDGFNTQNFLVKPGADRIFSVEGTEVAPAWSPYGGLWFHYVDKPLRVVVETPGQPDDTHALVDAISQLQLGVGIGLFNVLELELVAPVTLSSNGDHNAFPELGSAGLGDMLVRLRAELLGRAIDGGGFGLNLGVAVGIPTGSDRGGTGDGGVTVRPTLAMTFGAGPVLLALNAGVNVRADAASFENVDFGHELALGFGVEARIVDAFALGAELTARTQLASAFSDQSETPVELIGGGKVRILDGLEIDAGGGLGLTSGYGAPAFRIFVGAQWAIWGGDPDTDGDGIKDSVDQCPNEPEDKDGFEDEDGCPDYDNDKDGVPDVRDKCPITPEDIDGYLDDDGCPDPDNDQDGIPDIVDRCPDQPEDKDGFEDEDGCPDLDNDADGILDAQDKCPTEPETENGYQDDDGCPDTVPLARVEGCKIVIGESIHFKTGRATIAGESYELLDAVAAIMKGLEDYDHVMIEGHTDSMGSAKYNKALSAGRAKSVRTYLQKAGIPSKKMRSAGYGEARPIASNDTEEGRAQNRRVDFNVIGGKCKQ